MWCIWEHNIFHLLKPDPVSDYWTEGITASTILQYIRTVALSGGGGFSGLMGSFGLSVK